MKEPSKEEIDKLKAAHPDRAFKLINLDEKDGESLCFVVTGPNRAEYEKLVEDMAKYDSDKLSDVEKVSGVSKVMETLALQQIRWPARTEVQALFDKFPTISMQLGARIREYAGDSFEVRSKKL